MGWTAEEVGAALQAGGATLFAALAGGLLVTGAIPATPQYLFVLLAGVLATAGTGAGLLIARGRLSPTDADVNLVRQGGTACLFAAIPVANLPPAGDWYFRELFLLGGAGTFLGGVCVLGIVVVRSVRGGRPP